MRAVLLTEPGKPLQLADVPEPTPKPGQLLLQVSACAVCRTDLHLRDAELKPGHLPLILGHQIVARTQDGRRVGVSWLAHTDGTCAYCTTNRENLCVNARFTGRDVDGGFAQYTVADERFCLELPDAITDEQAAPLLCGGLIGYRALRLAGDARRIGLYGFGSAAHQICQVAVQEGRTVYAFTRPGDTRTQQFATRLGAAWAGGSDAAPPDQLDAALIFAPAGPLVPQALKQLAPGGTVICAGIHMSDIPSFPYEDLWQERSIRSVANLTRQDGIELLRLAAQIHTTVTTYPLHEAEQALEDLRAGAFDGTAVLIV
ncbi:MAG: zinc-dependent alcohol dehydrogenase family protein [Solirubrobacteraceae bacterium]